MTMSKLCISLIPLIAVSNGAYGGGDTTQRTEMQKRLNEITRDHEGGKTLTIETYVFEKTLCLEEYVKAPGEWEIYNKDWDECGQFDLAKWGQDSEGYRSTLAKHYTSKCGRFRLYRQFSVVPHEGTDYWWPHNFWVIFAEGVKLTNDFADEMGLKNEKADYSLEIGYDDDGTFQTNLCLIESNGETHYDVGDLSREWNVSRTSIVEIRRKDFDRKTAESNQQHRNNSRRSRFVVEASSQPKRKSTKTLVEARKTECHASDREHREVLARASRHVSESEEKCGCGEDSWNSQASASIPPSEGANSQDGERAEQTCVQSLDPATPASEEAKLPHDVVDALNEEMQAHLLWGDLEFQQQNAN